MSNTPKIALSVFALAVTTNLTWAQPTEDDLNPQNRNPVGTQAGSSALNSEALSLEQLALLKPAELEGRIVTGGDGERIGAIEEIAIKQTDQGTYALINTEHNGRAAVRLSELEIESLSYAVSDNSPPEDEYQSNEYERFSPTRTDPQGNAGAEVSENAATAVPGTLDTAERAARGIGLADEMDESLVEHLAMAEPDNLEGKKLMSEDGEELGEIDHVARSRNDDSIVAIVNSNSSTAMRVIPLADLQIAEVRYDGDLEDLEEEGFDADDFETLNSAG